MIKNEQIGGGFIFKIIMEKLLSTGRDYFFFQVQNQRIENSS
jgi:hypothetical protein